MSILQYIIVVVIDLAGLANEKLQYIIMYVWFSIDARVSPQHRPCATIQNIDIHLIHYSLESCDIIHIIKNESISAPFPADVSAVYYVT